MAVSNRSFFRDLYREHFDEAGFLFNQRLAHLDDPEIPWTSLEQIEERFEAHIDALVLGGELAEAIVASTATEGDPGYFHASVTLFCRKRNQSRLFSYLTSIPDDDRECLSAAAIALGREAPSEWLPGLTSAADLPNSRFVNFVAPLIRYGQMIPTPHLTEKIGRLSPFEQADALDAIGRAPQWAAILAEYAWSPTEAIRRAALLGLARQRDPALFRISAEQCRLGQIPPDLVPFVCSLSDLRALLQSPAAVEPPQSLLESLGRLGSTEVVPTLLRHLDVTAPILKGIFGIASASADPHIRTETAIAADRPEEQTWKDWWDANRSSFDSSLRYRNAQPITPNMLVSEIASEQSPRRCREQAYLELVARYNLSEPFDTGWWAAAQHKALLRIRQWLDQMHFQAGGWYRAGQLGW